MRIPRPWLRRPEGVTETVQPDPATSPRADGDIEEVAAAALFDHEWYSLCLGRASKRPAAAAHYLDRGRAKGLTPQPLFVPTHYAARATDLEKGDDPFLHYLRRRAFDVPTHPLFDLDVYLREHPDALQHPDGPLGHYRDVGAAAGATVNAWYEPAAIQPRGLVDWLYAEAAAWEQRRRPTLPSRAGRRPAAGPGSSTPTGFGLTTVVLVVERGGAGLEKSVDSLLCQSHGGWELVLVRLSPAREPQDYSLPQDARIRVLASPATTRWEGRNVGAAAARGDYVAWMLEGDEWVPDRLAAVTDALLDTGAGWSQDRVADTRTGVARRVPSALLSSEAVRAGVPVELGSLVVTRELLGRLGGFDASLLGGHAVDLALRMLAADGGHLLDRVGVRCERTAQRLGQPPPANHRLLVDHERLGSAADSVLNRHLVDWEGLAARRADPHAVSVIVPTHHDHELTRRAVTSVVRQRDGARRVQVLVVDNGSPVTTAAVLSSLEHELDDVVVVRSPVNRGFALGNNIALPEAVGETVVFLNNDTEVQAGWLDPLLEALQDERVLAAQSLLVYPDGSVQSAGIVFPVGGTIPHMLLQGFPVEDAEGMESDRLGALTAAALAVRRDDVLALRGFDPWFRNGMEDADFCLRLAELREGHFTVCPQSRVWHAESQSPGRFAHSAANRRLFLERWGGRVPQDDVDAWRRRGYLVRGHRVDHVVDPDRRVCAAMPVLARTPAAGVCEGVPRLRWALKNPAPSGPEGELWGDTHFARQLAAALRRLGQDVVIDHRQAFHRPSEWLDDVVLLLRGLAPYTPVPDRVNLCWLISHPDMYERREHLGWDRVYVASTTFAERLRGWGAPAVPLLQATDPEQFHPDTAAPDTGPEVLFVGNSRKRLRTMVDWAVRGDVPISVVGQHWEGLIPMSLVTAGYIPNRELSGAYRSAGVVLNDHWGDMAREGFLSNRLFDAVASGARVISDAVPGLVEVLGDTVVVVDGPDQLAEAIDKREVLFGDDEVVRERARRVGREHSFDERARVLLDDAVRIRAERDLGRRA